MIYNEQLFWSGRILPKGRNEDKMIKKIYIEDAVGRRLAHDLTQIIPGKFKGVAFRKGHVVQPQDVPKLLDMGKKQVFVLTLNPGEVHENEAAKQIARAAAGPGVQLRGPREGKVDFLARFPGLLQINVDALRKINALGMVILSTRHSNSYVRRGEFVAGTRAIPLTLKKTKLAKVEKICRRTGPLIRVLRLPAKKVGILVTGSEIFEKRIPDQSIRKVQEKVEALGSKVIRKAFAPDDPAWIAREIGKMKAAGCEIIVTTGGLSVDPDDVTLEGIRKTGAEIITYGVPVLPGSMSVYAQLGKTVIIGAPACVVHDPTTAFDLIFPRVVAGVPILPKEIAAWGHGGLCLKCQVCRYPVCPYGKGG
jgi:hypothetical protein